ncbi:hypothetical protein M2S24_12715, partial [Klebsiella pneumoniae]|nr:hypothetical protein [Klebsiella pneumoniae]
MARPKTAQPNHSLRKVAAVVATAVSGMSVYAQAAEQPKQEETITVVAAPAAQESAWGPAPTIAAKRSATATKTDTLKWFTEFGHLNRGDMLTSEQHRCHNEKKKF